MRKERFRQLLAAYGADPGRWPAGERDAALALLAAEPELRALVGRERWLNDLLDAHDPGALPGLAAAGTALPRHLPPQRRRFWAWLGGERLWPEIATLAAAALLGVTIGWQQPADDVAVVAASDPASLISEQPTVEELLL